MDTATTTEDGTATLVNRSEERIVGFQRGRLAAIEYNSRLTIVPGVEIVETLSESTGTAVSSLLDRKLARPGETVHVKGARSGEWRGLCTWQYFVVDSAD